MKVTPSGRKAVANICFGLMILISASWSHSQELQESKAGKELEILARGKEPESGKTCKIDFKAQALKLPGEFHYAKAQYEISDDCKPTLVSVRYSREIPTSAISASRVGASSQKVASARLEKTTAVAAKAFGQSCTVNVWEEDIVQIRMIRLINHTYWETENREITTGKIDATSQALLDWWHLNGPPSATIGYVREWDVAASAGAGTFYCNGVVPVPGIKCDGPSYVITLRADITFDGDGNCTGQGSYTGELVFPPGRVNFEIIR